MEYLTLHATTYMCETVFLALTYRELGILPGAGAQFKI